MAEISIGSIVLAAVLVAWTVVGRFRLPRLKKKLALGNRAALISEFRMTIIGQILMAVFAIAVAGPGIFVARHSWSFVHGAVWAAVITIVGLGITAAVLTLTWQTGKRLGDRPFEAKTLGDIGWLIPRSSRERQWFAGLSLCAGLCEEVLFRGFIFFVLSGLGVNTPWIIIAGGVIFGLAHLYQGPKGIAATGLLGLLLGGLYATTGTLAVPMVVHAAFDLRVLLIPERFIPNPASRTEP